MNAFEAGVSEFLISPSEVQLLASDFLLSVRGIHVMTSAFPIKVSGYLGI